MSNSKPSPSVPGVSFRSRLIWNSVLLVVLTAAATALFALLRTSNTIQFLTDQLTESVTNETQRDINATVSERATELDSFFTVVADDMVTLGASIESMLEQEEALRLNSYWDSHGVLSQIPSGGWDNPNVEPGSIFVQPRQEIPETIYSELNTLKQVDFIAPGLLQKNSELVAVYFGSQQGVTLYYPNIDLANILPTDFNITERDWYKYAAPDQNPERGIVWSEPYQDAALHGLVVTCSLPIYDSTGRFRGVLGMDIKLTSIDALITSIRIANTGYAFLLDGEGRVITMTDTGLKDFGLAREEISGEKIPSILPKVPFDVFQVLAKMMSNQTGLREITLNGVDKHIAYRPLPSVGYSLGVIVPVSETRTVLESAMRMSNTQSRNTLIQIGAVTLIILALSVLASRWLGNTLASPLLSLTTTAEHLAEGDLNAEAEVRSRDEFGILAKTFNGMASRLRDIVGSLEQRVAERTSELEAATRQSERRARDLGTVSEVARAISSEMEFDVLLNVVSSVVSDRFGYYHVGVFLIGNDGKYAILRASNSAGGKRMVTRGHRLEVGHVGIVGHVAASGEPRIALDVGEDAVFFNNPDLPDTRSEVALPLRVRGRIIGVLDVQSTEPNAFTQANVETLDVLADEIAIALDNSRLLAEAQRAAKEARALYGEYINRSWDRHTQNIVGYLYSPSGGQLLNQPLEWEEARAAAATGRVQISKPGEQEPGSSLAVPIRLQNQVIGVIEIRVPDQDRRWRQDEIAVVEATAERLGLALENARLFQETSSRAARERTVADISSKIRQTNDPQVIIRTAIEELQRALGASRVEIVPHVVPTHAHEDDGKDGREAGNS